MLVIQNHEYNVEVEKLLQFRIQQLIQKLNLRLEVTIHSQKLHDLAQRGTKSPKRSF